MRTHLINSIKCCLLLIPASFLATFILLLNDATGAETEDLDTRVKKFLDSHNWGWGDANVPSVDGQTLHDIILEHQYTRALEIGTSTGHSGIWTGTMVDFKYSTQRYFLCAGSLGWGFPAALGVKCALPDRPVLCFTGDGVFYYHIAELETARRWNINLVVLVNNNSGLFHTMAIEDFTASNSCQVLQLL